MSPTPATPIAIVAAALVAWPRIQQLSQRKDALPTNEIPTIAAALQNPNATPLKSLFELVEGAMTHQANQADSDAIEWQGKVTALQLRIDDLTTALAQAAASKTAPSASLRRISDDPEKFGGTEKDIAKRQQQYVNWRSQIQRSFGMDQHVFNTEFRRIQHIASLLTDDAYELFREDFEAITENATNPSLWTWQKHTEVFITLNTQYATLDLSRQAKIDFDKLWMTNKPFQNFIAEFNKLALKAGKTNLQKVEALKLKVSQELSDASTNKDNKPAADDFTGWCTRFHGIYQDLQEKAHLDALRQNRLGPRSNPRNPEPQAEKTTATAPRTPGYGDPMVLDARQQPRPSREQCIQQGLCFYCKKPGHSKSACHEKAANDTKFGRSTQPSQLFVNPTANQRNPLAAFPRLSDRNTSPSPRSSSPNLYLPPPHPTDQYLQPTPLQRLRSTGLENETPSSPQFSLPPSPQPYTPASTSPSYVPESENA
jgi:hypothetical protein